MNVKRRIYAHFTLLMILALLVRSGSITPAYATPERQESQPGSLVAEPGAVLQEVEAMAGVTPGVNYLTYSSLLFKPIRGKTDFDYNFSLGTLYLLTNTVIGEFAIPLSLPDKTDIREITFYFRDNSATYDLTMGLCRVAIGGTASGCLNALTIVNSTGVNTTALLDRTRILDPVVTVDNANYSYFLVAHFSGTGTQFGLVSGRVGFADSSFLPSIQR